MKKLILAGLLSSISVAAFAGIRIDGTTCLSVQSDQIYHDTDCDGSKDAGEEFIDQVGGGGGASSLEVFSNFDGTRSSPTASISIGDSMKLTVTGSTAVFNVDFASVTAFGFNGVIKNQNSLQSGSTFYVSSGTVGGEFSLVDSASVLKRVTSFPSSVGATGPLETIQTKPALGTPGSYRIAVTTLTTLPATATAGQTELLLTPPLAGSDGQVELNIDGVNTWLMDVDNVEINVPVDVRAGNALRLRESGSTNFVAFKSSAAIAYDQTYVLPNSTGTVDQVLAIQAANSDGSRSLYWKTDTSGGGGGGTTIEVEEGGSSVVNTSTTNYGAGIDVSNSGGEALIVVDLTEASGLTADPQQIRFSTGGTQVAISTGANFVEGSGITLTGAETGNRFDLTIAATLGTSITASEIETDAVSADELNATGVEAELEAVLDLNELQGQIGDAQIADGAVDGGTGGEVADDSLTTADLGADSVGASELASSAIQSGDIEEGDLPSSVDLLTSTNTKSGAQIFASSITLPSGSGYNVDATGEIGVQTNVYTTSGSSGTIVFYSGATKYYVVATTAAPADNQIPKYDSTLNQWNVEADGGGSGSPGGSDTQVQFNDGGSFGGDSGFTYNKTTDKVTVSSANVSFIEMSTASLVYQIRWADGTVQTSSPVAGGGSGDVTDVFDCASGNCAQVTMSDGDYLDASVLTPGSREGIIISTDSACTSATYKGQLCHDTDDYTIHIGTGGGTKRIGKVIQNFLPEDAQFFSAEFPQYNKVNGTTVPISGLAYDASLNESAHWKFIANDYVQGNLTLTIYWYADTASSGNVVWSSQIMAITANTDTQDIETDAWATAQTFTDSHLGTTGQRLHSADITISNLDSLAAGDHVMVRIQRVGISGSDTLTGDVILTYATLSF